jgi:phospholipid/cholesterol/gamma-HCH transport system substrate-binding protein
MRAELQSRSSGIFALLGIMALTYLSFRLARVEFFPAPGYTMYASFDVSPDSSPLNPVEIAGVQVGKVTAISLHDGHARVWMMAFRG